MFIHNQSLLKNFPKMPLTPFTFYLENKMISEKNKVNFNKKAFENKCKMEWNCMPDKSKLFWINYAFDQETRYQEKLKKNKNSAFIRGSCGSILNKNRQAIRISMTNSPRQKITLNNSRVPEKSPSSAYTYRLFHRSMLDSEEVIKMKPKERSSYIAQCWQKCKPPEKYDSILKVLPALKLDKNLRRKTRGETSKEKDSMNSSKSTLTKEKNDFLINGPEIPPACAFYLFMRNYNDLYPHSDDAMNVWRKLSAEDRNIYNNILHDMRKQYAIDYKSFLEGNNLDKIEKYIMNANKARKNYLDQSVNKADMIETKN